MRASNQLSALVAAAFSFMASGAIAADGGDWIVSRSSGEVWLAGSDVQQVSLKQEDQLKPGESIRTGRNGRVLLKRGEESILIAPNSVVGLPAQKTEGLATTIVQQAGSILLDVEKRNVKHFEVETPYLAAVVKGTQFRVTVNAGKTSVDVIRGQVEVADFKSGQIARVMAGQHATAFAHSKNGLSLGGTGTLNPIEQGKPRASSIERIPVPRNGLSMPRNAANGQNAQPSRQATVQQAKPGVMRISTPIGEARLNVHRATRGLARDNSAAPAGGRNVANKDTIWNSPGSATGTGVTNSSQGNGNAVAGANSTAASGVSGTIAAVSGADGGASGKGNKENNKGNGNANGNGNGNGKGKGNGANGNGHGHANGHGKK
jgi:hypothetical protein